jgi:hypothetical protein
MRLIQIWSGRRPLEHCIAKMISTLYRGVGLGFVTIATEAGLTGKTSPKLLVFNEMVTTLPDLGCLFYLKVDINSVLSPGALCYKADESADESKK